MTRILSLKKKKEFKQLQSKGQKWVTPHFIIQCIPTETDSIRFSFIASRKVGNAVCRNRTRRRLRHVVYENLKIIPSGRDYVIIVRRYEEEPPFDKLCKDFQWSIGHLERLMSC